MDDPFLKGLRQIVSRLTGAHPLPSFLPSDVTEHSVPSRSTERKAAPPTAEHQPSSQPVGEPFPGNFYTFEFFIELKLEETVHLGYPKVPIRDMTTKKVRWGSALDWCWPNPSKMRVPWADDEQRGLLRRTLVNVEDALGAEGRIGNVRFRFEQVLDIGKNQVVYAFHSPEKGFRLAYGFDRRIFEPSYVPPNPTRNAGGHP